MEAEEEGGGDAQSPRPQTEVTPAEHEDTWSFDPLQGPQPHKRSEQQFKRLRVSLVNACS